MRAERINIEWDKKAHCWTKTTKMDYPRFEAWSSNGPIGDQWCLRIILKPGERPIEVSRLRSLNEAERFTEGMVWGLDHISNSKLSVENIILQEKKQLFYLADTTDPGLRL